MIDFSSLAQWLNANKGTISTAVDVARGVYDEVTGNDVKKAEAERKRVAAEQEKARKKEIQYQIRQKEELKIHKICLPIILRSCRKSGVTSATMIAMAKIDYLLLQKLLKNLGIEISIFTLHTIVPLCSLDSLANRIAIYVCDKRRIRPLSSDF